MFTRDDITILLACVYFAEENEMNNHIDYKEVKEKLMDIALALLDEEE